MPLFCLKETRWNIFCAKVIEVIIETYPLLDRITGGIQEYQQPATQNLEQHMKNTRLKGNGKKIFEGRMQLSKFGN